ncbi:hypothetical protein HGRIS_009888 [Hohenbuehelia grisea]|uniref:Fungal-type protein kinase domain-containing protein n=1 Tax=Hohenbuehelia grisea TaxID=104357 RepID=A0ABR3J401_9AGAR
MLNTFPLGRQELDVTSDKEHQQTVRDDGDLIHLTDSAKIFIDAILPTPDSVVCEILKIAKSTRVYDTCNSCWANIPASEQDDGFRASLVDALNFIHATAKRVHHCTEPTSLARFFDHYEKHPLSTNASIPPGKPDILLPLLGGDDSFRASPFEPSVVINHSSKGTQKDIPGGDYRVAAGSSEGCEPSSGEWWWHQLVTVVDVPVPRRDHSMAAQSSWEDAAIKLISDLRLIMEAQFDRRFIIGLLASGNFAQAWLVDRSGALGSSTMINIHEWPQYFIKMVAAFAVLPPVSLGYDPNLRLYLEPPNVPTHSYSIHRSLDPRSQRDLFTARWVLCLNGTDWVTLCPLSLFRMRIWRGAAQATFVVAKLAEFRENKLGCQMHVLKQSWNSPRGTLIRQGNSLDEARIYSLAGSNEFVPDLLEVVDVMTDGDTDTTSVFRRGLILPYRLATPPANRRKRTMDDAFHDDPPCLVSVQTPSQPFLRNHNYVEPIYRTRTIMIMRGFNVPIRYFADLPELVSIFVDVLKGHRSLYEKGILHQDISLDNIVISLACDNTTSAKGKLIDLDNAATGAVSQTKIPVPVQVSEVELQDYTHLIAHFQRRTGIPEESQLTCDTSVLLHALMAPLERPEMYIEAILAPFLVNKNVLPAEACKAIMFLKAEALRTEGRTVMALKDFGWFPDPDAVRVILYYSISKAHSPRVSTFRHTLKLPCTVLLLLACLPWREHPCLLVRKL